MVFVTRENVLNTKNSVFRVGPIIVRRFHVPSDKKAFSSTTFDYVQKLIKFAGREDSKIQIFIIYFYSKWEEGKLR
jgi:hypothetical protein